MQKNLVNAQMKDEAQDEGGWQQEKCGNNDGNLVSEKGLTAGHGPDTRLGIGPRLRFLGDLGTKQDPSLREQICRCSDQSGYQRGQKRLVARLD